MSMRPSQRTLTPPRCIVCLIISLHAGLIVSLRAVAPHAALTYLNTHVAI